MLWKIIRYDNLRHRFGNPYLLVRQQIVLNSTDNAKNDNL